MFELYPKLENMIRSYFNQDTVAEIGTTNINAILDIYLSEVPKEGARQLLNEVVNLLEKNNRADLNCKFKEHFKGYIDITPVDDFFKSLHIKFVEKYPNPATKAINTVQVGNYIVDGWGRVRTRRPIRKTTKRVTLIVKDVPQPIAASAKPKPKSISPRKKQIARRILIKWQISQALDDQFVVANNNTEKKFKV